MKTQDFIVGTNVKIGFMTLEVVKQGGHSSYGLPRAWLLKSAKGVFYSFIPHNGVCRLNSEADFK